MESDDGIWLRRLAGQASINLSLFECKDGENRVMITLLEGSNDDLNYIAEQFASVCSAVVLKQTIGKLGDGLPNDQDPPHEAPPNETRRDKEE